jgi:integrase
MEREKSSASGNPDEQPRLGDKCLAQVPVASELPASRNVSWNFRHKSAASQYGKVQSTKETRRVASQPKGKSCVDGHSMTAGEFVQIRFIPEYVATKGPAGRAHFQAILKYVLTPEQVAGAFPAKPDKAKVKLREILGWPYLGFLPLCEVNADAIQHLTSTALQFGYSTQTVAHIRSVIRAIFSHAIATSNYSGDNPAALVTLSRMARKEPHALTVTQLKELIPVMRYPERHIALFATLTDLNLSEICGLQWKYVNLSSDLHLVDEAWIPGKTIAVRNQSYRGQLAPVADPRQRIVPVPELLCSTLDEIRSRGHFVGPEDFVLVSRKGTPIYPENIAARRLKPIGRTLEMPWLSWHVFHRTNTALGRQLHKELKDIYRSTGL